MTPDSDPQIRMDPLAHLRYRLREATAECERLARLLASAKAAAELIELELIDAENAADVRRAHGDR